MEVMTANRNWNSRPADERMRNLNALIDVANQSKQNSAESKLLPAGMKFIATGDGDILLGYNNKLAGFSNFGFKTVCTLLGVPYGFVTEKLDNHATVATLNYRLTKLDNKPILFLFEKKSNGPEIQAASTESYSRVWDADILPAMKALEDGGWYNPIAMPNGEPESAVRLATDEDIGKYRGRHGNQVTVGSRIVDSGMFRGDQDMFCMMMNKQEKGEDDGFGNGLFSVAHLANSQVYGKPVSFTRMVVESVCLNLICWQATDIQSFSYRHVGAVNHRVQWQLRNHILAITNNKVNYDPYRKLIKALRSTQIDQTQDRVVEKMYNLKLDPIFTKKFIDLAVDTAGKFQAVSGNPFSYYGVFGGMTRMSQLLPNQNERMAIDTAVGKGWTKIGKLLGV